MEIILFLAGWGVASAAAGFLFARLFRTPAKTADDVAFENLKAMFEALPRPDDPLPRKHEDVCMVKHNPDAQ